MDGVCERQQLAAQCLSSMVDKVEASYWLGSFLPGFLSCSVSRNTLSCGLSDVSTSPAGLVEYLAIDTCQIRKQRYK